jgi:hypothetical protein
MKAADLARAQKALDELRQLERLSDRLRAGEQLRLVLGGDTSSEIVLAMAYQDQIRRDVIDALASRVKALRGDLEAIGVEP